MTYCSWYDVYINEPLNQSESTIHGCAWIKPVVYSIIFSVKSLNCAVFCVLPCPRRKPNIKWTPIRQHSESASGLMLPYDQIRMTFIQTSILYFRAIQILTRRIYIIFHITTLTLWHYNREYHTMAYSHINCIFKWKLMTCFILNYIFFSHHKPTA